MKKIIALFLTVILVIGCGIVAVQAVGVEDKYSDMLAAKLQKLGTDDLLRVGIWLAYDGAVDHGFTQDDFDDPQAYLEAVRAAEKAYHLAQNQQYAAELAQVAEFEITYISKYTPCLFVDIKAAEVPKIAAADCVAFLDDLPAIPLPEPSEGGLQLYAEKFAAWIGLPAYDPASEEWQYGTYDGYDELYYHTASQGAAPDWTLIKAHVEMYDPWEVVYYKKLGDRVLVSWCVGAGSRLPFELAVYDAKDATFYDLWSNSVDDEAYAGLADAVDSLGLGYQLGDTDMNGAIDIADATMIQRCAASMTPPEGEAYLDAVGAIGDLDGDGMDLYDATILQCRLAGIDR